MSTSAIDALYAGTGGTGGTGTTKNDAASADRFLKLLVAQMQNQDPLNPMDNAQVTSQMAQINTVAGIDKLNGTVQSLNAQFVQMQALQGASLVGRDVTVAGDRFAAMADGSAQAGFELDGPADSVTVEVLNAAGHVVDKIQLGALGSGRHGFEWDAAGLDPANHSFRVSAQLGAASVGTTPLMLDRVQSVANGGDGLTLQLERSGSVSYADVRAFN